MCGLVGAMGPLTLKHENAFKLMLIFDSIRGIDSTGIAVVNAANELKIAKSVGDPYVLFDTIQFQDAMKGVNKLMIGHNRFATQGKVNKANAHPFDFESLIGAHNGTLRNKQVLADSAKFQVDSQNLYHHIDQHGLKDALKNLDGAWALTWYDKEFDTMNFLRNKERPLFLTITEDDVIFWASEKWMLEVALARQELKHGDIEPLPEDMHHVFAFDGRKLNKPVASKMASGYEPPFRPAYQGTAAWGTPTQTQQTGTQTTTTQGSTGQHTVPNLTPNPYGSGVYYRFKVIGEGLDISNNPYYILKDAARPNEKLRLYRHVKDTIKLMNEFIECCVHQYRYADRTGSYLKAEYSSMRKPSIMKEDVPVVDAKEGQQQSAGKFFCDSKGKLIPQDEWNKKHGSCANCTGHVDPEENFKFTTEGETICHECVADPEVANYVNFR